ncbi:MAG: hypothetical protein U5L45_22365 [Saprospiraceae bacterium]|nr:hypothetical protein [Saprospiraceae bacterium]
MNNPRNVFRTEYNTTQGVQFGVNRVDTQVFSPSNRSIAIGQSMGGIVARELDRQQPNVNYGGIITLGSPNRGGVILNALQNGTIQGELNEGCREMGDAIGSSLIAIAVDMPFTNNPVFFTLQGVFAWAGGIIIGFRNRLCDELINVVNANLPTNDSPQTVADLSEGSNIIDLLNNTNTPSFKIGVFGVENSPVHMRVLGSLQNDPFAQQLDVSNTDEEMVNTFNQVIDVFNTLGSVFGTIAIVQAINAIWNWPLLIPAAINAWAAYECYDAVFWLLRSESRWHQVIGAGGFFTERRLMQIWTSACRQQLDEVLSQWERGLISAAQMRLIRQTIISNPTCFENAVVDVLMPINNESDGLFNAGTQRIPNDPFDERHVVNERVDGVNHREFYNHFNMTAKFREIFNGNTLANPFFITQ